MRRTPTRTHTERRIPSADRAGRGRTAWASFDRRGGAHAGRAGVGRAPFEEAYPTLLVAAEAAIASA